MSQTDAERKREAEYALEMLRTHGILALHDNRVLTVLASAIVRTDRIAEALDARANP